MLCGTGVCVGGGIEALDLSLQIVPLPGFFFHPNSYGQASLVAQMVKNPPVMQETQV